jgi:cell division protein FtsQ
VSKFKNIAIVSLAFLSLLTVLGLAETTRNDVTFNELKVEIDVSDGNYFVDDLDIESQVFAHGYQTGMEPIINVNLRSLEMQFDAMPSVKKAEVYTSLDGRLKVDIKQRTPIARVYTRTSSFYIDKAGYIMPLSDKYTAKVPVVNGDLNIDYTVVAGQNFATKNELMKTNFESRKLYEAYWLAKKFKEVAFWDAQFKQIYFRSDGDIELIPAVGNHVIIIDGVANIDESLTKLMILYKEGLSKTGWNNYKEINLKYKDQIVCKKR